MSYKVKLVSQPSAAVLIVTIIATTIICAAMLLPPGGLKNGGLSLLIVLAIMIIACVLWQIFVTGRSVWTIDEQEIKIEWTRRYVLEKVHDIAIEWNAIKNIRRGADRQYYALIIELVSGDTIKHYHDPLARDDFEAMLKKLYQTLTDREAMN